MSEGIDSLAEALRWMREGRRVALATVISTWGSSPRSVGARMIIDRDGDFRGSVSGGCIEAEIIATAEDVLDGGRPVVRTFRVTDERAAAVGLACGGSIAVFVERLDDTALLEEIHATVAAGGEVTTVVSTTTGDRRRLAPHEPDRATGEDFREVWRPALRLVIVGAVHIAQALAPIAATLGYRVSVVDPRTAFATAERFPGIDLHPVWPEAYFRTTPLDGRCAVVALTHEPRIDDPAIAAALASPAFYVGALGSRATAEKRRARLRESGLVETDLARIHGPIGLDLGAGNPAEIAVAIAAEMTVALRRPEATERRGRAA